MSTTPGSKGPGDRPAGPATPTFGDLFWLGTACAISVVGAGALGYWIDTAAGTLPWGTVVGLAFGVTSAVLLAVNRLRKFV